MIDLLGDAFIHKYCQIEALSSNGETVQRANWLMIVSIERCRHETSSGRVQIFRDLPHLITKLLVIYSVIHKRVFTPLRNLPTRLIEAVNHSSNSTIAFTRKNYG